ncbi:MAG TPA: hypothetical protein VGY76_00965 [Solirubrobacteraceae bacterium]|nr:hypothetical protein [Solirubrobacteraceae bacterium]
MLVLVLALAQTGEAAADSATISVTNTAGQSDPAAGVPRVFTISGVASIPEDVFVKYRAPGGAPCAPNAESDSGSTLEAGQHEGRFYFAYGDEVNGAFNLQQVYNWSPSGTFAFCIWLAKDSSTIATPIPQTITFRSPVGTIAASVSSTTPGHAASVTVAGSSESPAKVYAKIRSAGGAACAVTFGGDSGESLISGEAVNGSFSVQATTKPLQAGQYTICLWLAYSENDTSPIAGPQPVTFAVALPPSPPPISAACLRDRSVVPHELLLVRAYTRKLRSHHLSRRARRNDRLALSRARATLRRYEGLRHTQCPGGL